MQEIGGVQRGHEAGVEGGCENVWLLSGVGDVVVNGKGGPVPGCGFDVQGSCVVQRPHRLRIGPGIGLRLACHRPATGLHHWGMTFLAAATSKASCP